MKLEPGDEVTRIIGGTLPMVLVVTEITEKRIVCGMWEFDRKTGLEEDHYLGWGAEYGVSGSYLKEVAEEAVRRRPLTGKDKL